MDFKHLSVGEGMDEEGVVTKPQLYKNFAFLDIFPKAKPQFPILW